MQDPYIVTKGSFEHRSGFEPFSSSARGGWVGDMQDVLEGDSEHGGCAWVFWIYRTHTHTRTQASAGQFPWKQWAFLALTAFTDG